MLWNTKLSTEVAHILLLKKIRSQKPVYSQKQGIAHSKYFSIFCCPNDTQLCLKSHYSLSLGSHVQLNQSRRQSHFRGEKKEEKGKESSEGSLRVKRRQQWGLGLPDQQAGTSSYQERSRALLEPQQPALTLQ